MRSGPARSDWPARAGGPARSESSKGLLCGVGACGLWGLQPLYFTALLPTSPVEIVASRVAWSLVVFALFITVMHVWRAFGAAVSSLRMLSVLSLAAVLIAIN